MSVCPFDFTNTIEQNIDMLSLSYSFDITSSITTVNTTNPLNEGVSMNQSPKVPAIILNLGGRTSKAVLSIGINGKLTTFNLYDAYITKVFPKIKKGSSYNFVIEGIATKNVNGEKILIYIPLNPKLGTNTVGTTGNPFYPIETALTSDSNTLTDIASELNVDFNKLIPTNKYYYHTYTDTSKTLYNIITFDESNLTYGTIFGKILSASLDKKTTDYFSEIKEKNNATISYPLFMSITNPINQDIVTNSLDDNIYIDCQPTDLLNNEGGNYLQTSVKEMVTLVAYLERAFPYIIIIVFLTLLIIFTLSLSSFFKKHFGSVTEDPLTKPYLTVTGVLTRMTSIFRSKPKIEPPKQP